MSLRKCFRSRAPGIGIQMCNISCQTQYAGNKQEKALSDLQIEGFLDVKNGDSMARL